ncbi:uncharacterized protein LOC106460361 isoform X1 [Limulus polyphemus]|uniref:Uncharacterized protein LOC106460361 isoform X1 n=2 Tax=Limulus polyphemus TaxID=6850 RepID=A0ABM1SGL9_LIMPO|nr:uncharacterized protein LOC106460361 isoform X1 [Limulus polyphemus]
MDALYESKKVKDNFFIGICYENFGLISQDLKNYNKAVSFHKRALELMKQYGDQAHISKGNLYFAHDLCLIQDFEKAVYHTKESILGAETLRLKMGSDDASKVSSFDNRQISVFNFLIYQLLVQGKSGQALSVSELAHGRALSDMLAYKFKSSLELSNKTWLSEEDIISKSRLDNMFLEEEIPSFYISTANRFHTTILVYSLIMLADHPWLCIWVIKPIEFLKSGESSIHCIKVPGDKIFPSNKTERDRLFAKISKYTTQISHGKTSKEKTTAECNQGPNEAKCSPEDKATARGQMERITLSNSIENESYEALRLFYDVCIGPVAEFLPNPDDHNVTRITVIPSSWLFKVPFCALISPSKRYLIQDYIISYTPSLRSFLLLRHRLEERERNLKNRKLKVVAIGNPKTASCWELEELPGAENELKCVQNIFGIESCHVIDKEAATKEEIMKCMKEVDVLHVVSHGDTEEPVDCSDEDPLNFFFPDTYLMKGCLFLSPDGNKCNGLLCSRDLQDLFCDISLVTLSCCKTGSGQVTNDSILGLYRAFLVAGACGVVSSPWLVSDAITPYFMDNFYRCFLVDRDVPKALRSAMLNLIEANVSWKNWAAFSYTGALSLVCFHPVCLAKNVTSQPVFFTCWSPSGKVLSLPTYNDKIGVRFTAVDTADSLMWFCSKKTTNQLSS